MGDFVSAELGGGGNLPADLFHVTKQAQIRVSGSRQDVKIWPFVEEYWRRRDRDDRKRDFLNEIAEKSGGGGGS